MYLYLLDLDNIDLTLEEVRTYVKIFRKLKKAIISKEFNYPYFATVKYIAKIENFDKIKEGLIKVYSDYEISKEEKKEIIKQHIDQGFKFKNNPKYIIYLTKKEIIKGKIIWEREKFKEREPNRRPFNRPFTLKPKFARILVNLAKENFIVDPFAGTGTILIEAAFTKRNYLGIERDWKTANGCIKNLEYYNLKKQLILSDALFIDKLLKKLNRFAIATDPPYGKTSSLFGSKINELYEEFLEKAIKTNVKRMVFIIRKESELTDLIKKYKPIKYIDYFVNSNITRRIFIFDFHSGK